MVEVILVVLVGCVCWLVDFVIVGVVVVVIVVVVVVVVVWVGVWFCVGDLEFFCIVVVVGVG